MLSYREEQAQDVVNQLFEDALEFDRIAVFEGDAKRKAYDLFNVKGYISSTERALWRNLHKALEDYVQVRMEN